MLEVTGDQLVEAMIAPAFIVDAAGMIRELNSAAERDTGFVKSELVGRGIAGLIFDQNISNISWLKDNPACQTGAIVDAWLAPKSGPRVAVSVMVTPLPHAAGSAPTTLVLAHRQTAVVKLSSALALAEQRLADEREQRLRSERLATLGKLAGGIGHDLRNLAQLQVLALEALTHDVPALQATEVPALTDLERTSQQVANHAQRLLKLAHPGQDPVRPVSLGDVVGEVMATLGGAGKLRGVKTELDLEGGELNLMINRSRLEQVILNLAINAVEAMGIAGGTLRIAARNNGSGRVIVDIADTGPGIAAEALPRVFEPLFTTKPGATGLGLAVGKEIVEGHGGQLQLISNSSTGATFRFDLPSPPHAESAVSPS